MAGLSINPESRGNVPKVHADNIAKRLENKGYFWVNKILINFM